jgi:hypothetical protein
MAARGLVSVLVIAAIVHYYVLCMKERLASQVTVNRKIFAVMFA